MACPDLQDARALSWSIMATASRELCAALEKGQAFAFENRAGTREIAPAKDEKGQLWANHELDGARELVIRIAPAGKTVDEYPFPIGGQLPAEAVCRKASEDALRSTAQPQVNAYRKAFTAWKQARERFLAAEGDITRTRFEMERTQKAEEEALRALAKAAAGEENA